MDQYSQEQHMIAQQVKANGQAVAQLTLRQFSHEAKMEDGNDTDSVLFEDEISFKNVFADHKTAHKPEPSRLKKPHHSSGDKTSLPRHTILTMQFPVFDGNDPKIWKDNCKSYFELYSLPKGM